VRSGQVGEHEGMLSPALNRLLDELWRREIEGPLGFASYQDLRAALTPDNHARS
jgi:hypothetical protein